MADTETSSFGPLEPKRLVNRTEEMKAIGAALAAKDGKPRVFYFPGGAGVGKSRLLREARKQFSAQCHFAGFYDFDDTELHSNSRLEQRILDTLDPGDDKKYFAEFRAKRTEYLEARRIAPTAAELEEKRRELVELFAKGINEISAQQKLLFCFDTLETLQHESDTVQFPPAIRAEIEKLAIETLGWLAAGLPKWQNVVILMAGRPKPGMENWFRKTFKSKRVQFQKFNLERFSPEFVQEYLEVMAKTYEDAGREAIGRQFRAYTEHAERVHLLTDGQPILLAFATDLIHNTAGLPEEFKLDKPLDADTPEKVKALQAKVKRELMNLVMNFDAEIGFVMPYLALLRKGVTPDILQWALQGEKEGWTRARCKKVLDAMRGLSFAKPHPSDPNLPTERMYLHDEVYDVMGDQEIQPHIEQWKLVSRHMVKHYDQEIANAEQALEEWRKNRGASQAQDESAFEKQDELIAQVNHLTAKRLYYQLVANPFEGYAEYSRISDRAIINHQVGLDMMLRDEMLRFFDLTNPNTWRWKEAAKVTESQLSSERIMRGAAIRWVQRFIAQGQAPQAIAASRILQTDKQIHIKLKVADDPLFIAILKTYEGEAFLSRSTTQAIKALNKAIQLFERAKLENKPDDLKNQLRPRHLGRAYNNRGYAHARGNRWQEAIHDYQQALPRLRVTGLPHQTADTIKNLAFAYTNTGQLLAAEILCREAIRLCRENKLEYLSGMGVNTLAIVELQADNPNRAVPLAKAALNIFANVAQGGDKRGMGLANLVVGKANRVRAQLDIYSVQESRDHFGASEDALKSGYDTFKKGGEWHEPARELEALQQLGCLYRQWAHFEKTRANGSPQSVRSLLKQSREKFDAATKLVTDKYVGTQADLLNDLAELYWVQGIRERALSFAHQSDRAVRAEGKNYFIEEHKQPEQPRFQLYIILGKNALLRARIALKEADLEQAARHYTAASAYFDRLEGDPSARELAARRTFRMYQDLVDARLAAKQLEDFRQHVEQFQTEYLVSPWPHRTTTLGDNFSSVWSDLHLVLDL